MNKKTGRQSFKLGRPVRIIASGTFVGEKEGQGPLGSLFDTVCRDDTLGLDSWEQAESRMLESAVRLALRKTGAQPDDADLFMGGDLLNQIISAGFAARELRIPFIGLYGACSTIAESLISASMLIDGGFARLAVCGASSHFSSVERQFRYPLEMGTQASPTSQRTVTGAGAVVLVPDYVRRDKEERSNIAVTGGTIGIVRDYGITDAANMGAAMAPAAASTICSNLHENGLEPEYYDAIITGDLGSFGSSMLYELCRARGYDIEKVHKDCGLLVFSKEQNVVCGGSGCGCAATVLCARLLPKLESGELKRILFIATGALLSTVSSLQGESIPGVAHAAVIERMREI